MTINQLSIFVENKPGKLAEITAILRDHDIDIRALSIADTTHFGILRLIVDRPAVAEQALKDAGFTVSLTQVIAIGVADKPGGLAQDLALLNEGGVSVEYMYAFLSREEKTAYVILRVDDNQKAIDVLRENGVAILTEAQIVSGI